MGSEFAITASNKVRKSLLIQLADSRVEQSIESLRIFHHQEMANARHEDDLNAIMIEGSLISWSIVGIDGNYGQLQFLQSPRHFATVAES